MNAGVATLVVRTGGDSAAVVAGIRAAVLAIDPAQPIGGVPTVAKFLDDSLGPQRFRTALVAIFAAIALALALN